MDTQLKKLDISYTKLRAVYGKNLSQEEINRLYDSDIAKKNGSNNLTLGELGCALSHREIYKKIESEGHAYTLILEDDVTLPKNFKDIIVKEIEKNTSHITWDYLSFDYYAYGLDFLFFWLSSMKKIFENQRGFLQCSTFIIQFIIKCIALTIVTIIEELQKRLYPHQAIIPLKKTAFAGAYVLTKEGAVKLLSVEDKITYLADALPNVARKKTGLRFKIYNPLIVTQRKELFTSDLIE